MSLSIGRRQALAIIGMAGLAALDVLAKPLSYESLENDFKTTIRILTEAYYLEMEANAMYVSFSKRAKEENYPNIAYSYKTFAISEKIHADNYAVILEKLNRALEKGTPIIAANTTKKNLLTSVSHEMKKINVIYPGYLEELKTEGHKDAIMSCRYAYLSHKQHTGDLELVGKYTENFFLIVVATAEARWLNYHVCSLCGSTSKRIPPALCPICGKPKDTYIHVSRP